jgi:hypothetical protein
MKRSLVLVPLGALCAVIVATACGDDELTPASRDAGVVLDGCPQPTCGAGVQIVSTCGWNAVSSSCDRLLRCDTVDSCTVNPSPQAQTCTVDGLASDGTAVHLTYTVTAPGCGVCPTESLTWSDGGTFTQYECAEAGTDAGGDSAASDSGGDAASGDASDAANEDAADAALD